VTSHPRPADLVAPRPARASVCNLAPRLFGVGPVLRVISMNAACSQLYKQLSSMPPRNGGASAEESPLRVAARNAASGGDSAAYERRNVISNNTANAAQPPLDRGETSTDGYSPQAVSAPASPMQGSNRNADANVERHLPVFTVSPTPMRLCNAAGTALQMPC